MILEALRLALAFLLLVALPGYLLVRALFPARASLPLAQQLYLTLAGGVLLLAGVGIVLGFLPHASGRGAFQSLATKGMPNVELASLGVCLVLFWIGAARGAFPRVSARYPRLVAPWVKPQADSQVAQQQP